MRIFGNPDRIACWTMGWVLDDPPNEYPFAELGDEAQGILHVPRPRRPCANGPAPEALAADRQQMIAMLALHAFFESVWASDVQQRTNAALYLAKTLPRGFPRGDLSGDRAVTCAAEGRALRNARRHPRPSLRRD